MAELTIAEMFVGAFISVGVTYLVAKAIYLFDWRSETQTRALGSCRLSDAGTEVPAP